MKDFNYKICLIGMPGSGKTTIGRDLSKLLDYKFIDIDETIRNKTKMSISAIFENMGESYFRSIEKTAFKEIILSNDKIVISTGGGVVLDNDNILKKTFNIYLNCSYSTLLKRLENSKGRPLLKKNIHNKLKKLLIDRENLYLKYSNLSIDANGIKNNTLKYIIKKIK